MRTKGLSGELFIFSKYSISFSTRNPDTDSRKCVTPSVEAWALWHVPNASFTKTSPSWASFFANSGSFLVSSLWKRRFSRSTISPTAILLTISTTCDPIQSSVFFTGLLRSSSSLFATGARLIFFFISPFGRPRWLIRIIFAFFSSAYSIVGKAALILLSSVIFRSSSRGTLKSTLINTLLSLISMSFIHFLFILSLLIKLVLSNITYSC